jgi:hypothetical protein
MRRLVFAALAVVAAGGAFWLRERSSESSFAAYADSQLATLEQAYRAVMRSPPASGNGNVAQQEAALDAELSLDRLESERHRRLGLRGLVGVAFLSVVGALLPRSRRARARLDRGEEVRMRERFGDPALLLEGQRQEAARLLGVSRDAPREVIEAALAARLAMHGARPLEGIEPRLRNLAVEQRLALQRARNLLLEEIGAGPQPSEPGGR